MEYTVGALQFWNEKIEGIVKKFGLDCYEQEFEIIEYKDMLAYEAYVGMPSRYPHWSFGKAYEKNKTLYNYNLTGLAYEMVINSDPCLAYLMKENSFLLQILTMAHVYGHNDFFKNNRLFKEGTDADYTIEMFKTHANIIRSYINDPSIGYKNVERVLDAAHAIKLQVSRVAGERKLTGDELKNKILESHINGNRSKDTLLGVHKDLPFLDLNKIPLEPEEDILYFLINYGELNEWEKFILSIVRSESLYFMPQIETKIMNEGWASYWHYNILKELKLPQSLHFEFIKRHNDVIAPRIGGINPYYIGFKIFEDIEARYGREKIFEVREIERDESFIRRYLTEELCVDLGLFQYTKKGNDYVIDEISDETGWKSIRNSLASSCGMGMVPVIRVVDMSKKDKTLTLEHCFDGRELNMDFAEATLKHICELWGHTIILKTILNDKEVKMVCDETKKVVRINTSS
jgi:stage V sporulation protein R